VCVWWVSCSSSSCTEEKKEEGKTEPDGEAKPEGGEAKAEGGEQPPAQQEGEAEPASQTVTVEATIEGEQGVCVCMWGVGDLYLYECAYITL